MINPKYRELFLKSASLMRLIDAPVMFFLILWFSADLCSQSPATDSSFSQYDSIQDKRLEQIRQGTRQQMDRLREDHAGLEDRVDSLLEEQGVLEELLARLENDHRELSRQYRALREEADRAEETSATYRERLHRILWLTGTLILLLILGLSFYFFLYAVRIKNFLQRQISSVSTETGKAVTKIRRRQKKLRNELRGELKTRGQKIERRTRKDLRKRIRAQMKKS